MKKYECFCCGKEISKNEIGYHDMDGVFCKDCNKDDYQNTYGCEICGDRKDFDKEIVWITSSYGVCEKCYEKLTSEEVEKLRQYYE